MQSEEKGYMSVINGEKSSDRRSSSPRVRKRESSVNRKESVYEQEYHSVDEKATRIINALSPYPQWPFDGEKNIHADMEKGLKDELRSLDDQIGKGSCTSSKYIFKDTITY